MIRGRLHWMWLVSACGSLILSVQRSGSSVVCDWLYVPSPLLDFVHLRRLTDSHVRATGIWYMQAQILIQPPQEYASHGEYISVCVYFATFLRWVVGKAPQEERESHRMAVRGALFYMML